MRYTIVNSKIVSAILFIGSLLLVILASHYIADYYEECNQSIPDWVIYIVHYPLLLLSGLAGLNAMKVFSVKKRNMNIHEYKKAIILILKFIVAMTVGFSLYLFIHEIGIKLDYEISSIVNSVLGVMLLIVIPFGMYWRKLDDELNRIKDARRSNKLKKMNNKIIIINENKLKYEIENFGYLDQLIIEVRYALLTLIFPIGFIVTDYFNEDFDATKVLVIYCVVILIGLPYQAYRKHKSKTKNYITLSNTEFILAFGEHVDVIPFHDVLKCTIYNIMGNKNFVLSSSMNENSFLLNGINDDIVSEISKILTGVEIKKANLFEIFKYILK